MKPLLLSLIIEMTGRLLAFYLRVCFWTSRPTVDGIEAFARAKDGSGIILVCWHGQLLLVPALLAAQGVKMHALHDPSPVGRMAGVVMRRFGHKNVAISEAAPDAGVSRGLLRALRGGAVLALAADGPEGPAEVMKQAPLDWLRMSKSKAFAIGFSCSRSARLKTWDRMEFPFPFARQIAVFSTWEHSLPRRPESAEMKSLTQSLGGRLSETQSQAEERARR